MLSRMLVAIAALLPKWLVRRIGKWQAQNRFVHKIVGWGRDISRKQDMTIRAGVGAGLIFQTGDSNFGYILGTSEPQTQEALKKFIKPGSCFYDIGSNVGFLTVIGARLVGKEGQVYAFDPVAKHTELVQRNCDQNGFTNVKVFRNAVSAENGVAEFVISPRSAESRLNAAWDGTTGGEKVRVECVALDSLIETSHLRPPDVCKIDVEGAEVDVLKGMMKTLRQYKPVIVCDTHGTHKEVAAVLEEAGYWCGTMEHPDQPLSEAEYYAHALAVPAESHVPASVA